MSTLVLDPRAIVEALSCFKIGITADDIIHPSAERVQSIYRAFCMEILDVPEKSLSDLPFECIYNHETAELHQKSNPLLLLFTTMRCFMMDFGDAVIDFTMCDLINPQPKRTRKLLSVVADFTNFYRVASQVFEKTSSEYDDARKVIEEGQEQVRLAEERKNALRAEQDSRRRKENALLAESNKKNAILTEVLKEAQASESRRDAIIKSIKDGKQEIAKLLAEIKSLKSEIDHLSKGVVRSPVRVRQDVDGQRALIKRLQDDCGAERQRISANLESISVIEQTSRLLDERFKELDRLRDFQVKLNILEQDCANSKAQVAEASKFRMQREEALSRLAKSCEEEEENHIRASEVYSSRLEDLKLKKEELVSIVKNLRDQAPLVRDEISQLQKEMVRLRNERVEETEQARSYCLELRRRFHELLEKYQRAEEVFDSQAKLFSDLIRNISVALDDAESSASDFGSCSVLFRD